jgi:hypothetical protein
MRNQIKDYVSGSDLAASLKDAASFEFVFRNGIDPVSGKLVNIKDAMSVPDAPLLFPKVISNIVREAAEPLLVGTSLLQRINYSYGQTITFPAVGALTAGDIAEGQEYPEQRLAMGGASVTATIGKSGVAVKVTEEMIRYSQFDVLGMHLRAAGRALARHKEIKIFNMIKALGVCAFDNANPGQSMKGVTTGRNLAGAPNGSLTMDDLFDAFAQVMTQGFMPDTLLMHPLTWTMFVKDPTLRAFAMMNGGGTFFANWTGQPNQQYAANANQGGLGIGAGQNIVEGGNAAGLAASPLSAYNPQMNSAPVLPNYGLNFRIIVSPLVPMDPVRKLTDIFVFDSRELGALIVDEEVTTEEFMDPKVELRKIKLRERYALAILNEGQGIATIKNVHVVPNEIVLPLQATIDVASSSLGVIPPGTPVV